MIKYRKIFKINLFNLIYFPIVLFFYIDIFVNSNVYVNFEDKVNALFFSAFFLFSPILILIIINIFFIYFIKGLAINKKMILIVINIVPILSAILQLIFNNYFLKSLNIDFDQHKAIKRNSLLSSIFLSQMILFAIIYTILDITINNDYYIVAEVFSILFIISIFLFVYSYFILIFYSINFYDKSIKERLLFCIPYFNLIYCKHLS